MNLPLVQCRKPGCSELLQHAGLCPAHSAANYRQQDARRGTNTERGYDAKWRRARDYKAKRNPLCELCLKAGTIIELAEVHHIIPIAVDPSKRLELENLMSLCKPCHSRITMMESVR